MLKRTLFTIGLCLAVGAPAGSATAADKVKVGLIVPGEL